MCHSSYLSLCIRFCMCKCGRCSSQYLQYLSKFQCCSEIDECIQCVSNEMFIKEVGKKPTVLLCIVDSAKFAGRGGVCGWLPVNTKLKTKPSITRLVLKRGRLLSFGLPLLESIESLKCSLCEVNSALLLTEDQPLLYGSHTRVLHVLLCNRETPELSLHKV